ncbi:C40 family peptidase [Embleya sp. NPDC059259]|uniref:C40 family peptidase n=1 Tax=unclassified Embleya TaxID=2699296 RepID=UPI0036CFBEEC
MKKAGLIVGAIALSPLVMIAPIVIALSGTASAKCANTSSEGADDSAAIAEEVKRILAGLSGNVHIPQLLNPREQIPNAQTIVATGQALKVSARGQTIALAVAMQESTLINLSYGDRDSVGLFQQRPSQGWGSVEQIMDPVYAATKFYSALRKIKGWEQLTLGQAAQTVQQSGFPDAYDKWEPLATALQKAIEGVLPQVGTTPVNPAAPPVIVSPTFIDRPTTGIPVSPDSPIPAATPSTSTAPSTPVSPPPPPPPARAGLAGCTSTAGSGAGGDGSGFGTIPAGALPEGYAIPTDAPPVVQTAIRWALGQLGTPYQWGGTCMDPRGPDPMGRCDCSSLMQRAYAAAGIQLTRTTYTQVNEGTAVGVADLRPGDLVFTRGTAAVPEHVGMVIGGGLIVNAPKTGDVTRIATIAAWKPQILAARRIVAG